MTIRTQTKYPTVVVSDDAVGTLAWSDPSKAEVSDNIYAVATNGGGSPAITEYLKGTDFEFGLLSTATILGCQALVEKKGVTSSTITVVASASTNTGGGTSTISKPTGTVEGDVMVAVVVFNNSGSVTAPSGWTLMRSDGPTGRSTRSYYKVAGDSEPSSYSWSNGIASGNAGGITTFRGVDPATPLDVTPAGATQSGSSIAAPSVTAATPGAMLVAAFMSNTNGTWSPPSGMTERFDRLYNIELSVALNTQLLTSGGATGTRTGTTSSGAALAAHTIALRPMMMAAVDETVALVLADGTVGSENKATGADWPDTDTAVEYGADDDLWDEALEPDDVNDEDFGLVQSATLPAGGVASVDAMSLAITYDVQLDVTITAPSTTLDRPNGTLEWDAEVDGSAIVQASYRVHGYRLPSLTLIYDSGTVASATQEHTIGSGTPTLPWASPTDGDTIRWVVDVTEDGTADPDGTGPAIEGSGSADLENDWTPLPALTGFALTPVTEEEEGS